MTEAETLRWGASFLKRVRGDEDEYHDEYIRAWDEAVALLRSLADRKETQAGQPVTA